MPRYTWSKQKNAQDAMLQPTSGAIVPRPLEKRRLSPAVVLGALFLVLLGLAAWKLLT